MDIFVTVNSVRGWKKVQEIKNKKSETARSFGTDPRLNLSSSALLLYYMLYKNLNLTLITTILYTVQKPKSDSNSKCFVSTAGVPS